MAKSKNNSWLKYLDLNLLTLRQNSSFLKTFKKIKNTNKAEFIWLEKPQSEQMAAILANRLLGKKFFWIQNFSNPPIPNFISKFLITQADQILVRDSENATKLKKLGVDKNKIYLVKKRKS